MKKAPKTLWIAIDPYHDSFGCFRHKADAAEFARDENERFAGKYVVRRYALVDMTHERGLSSESREALRRGIESAVVGKIVTAPKVKR